MDSDSDSDSDDWLEPHAQGSSTDPLVGQEYVRMAQRFSDAGYREGITDGKLSTLQQGFDAGFAASVAPSRALGTLRGRAAGMLHLALSHSQSQAQAQPLFSSSAARPSQPTRNPGFRAFDRRVSLDSPHPSNVHAHAAPGMETLVEQLRDLIRDLSRVRRADVLPRDLEREEHEATHGEEEGETVRMTKGRELEGLMEGMAGMGGREGGRAGAEGSSAGGIDEAGQAVREEDLLRVFETRLGELQRALGLGRTG